MKPYAYNIKFSKFRLATKSDGNTNVEARGVPKNKVARQVVKELTAREVLSQSRIYEGLGLNIKEKENIRKV
jgi:hypothetical protein